MTLNKTSIEAYVWNELLDRFPQGFQKTATRVLLDTVDIQYSDVEWSMINGHVAHRILTAAWKKWKRSPFRSQLQRELPFPEIPDLQNPEVLVAIES